MPPAQGPIGPRRRIATKLRQLREEAGMSLDQVADELLISRAKLSRLERAQGSPQPRDVRDLLRLYGQDGTSEADRMLRWASAAKRQSWWNDYEYTTEGFARDLPAHLAYESEAKTARSYTIPLLPALLQVPDYIRAVYVSMEPWRSRREIEELVNVREQRIAQLEGREDMDPLRLIAVAHETCLRQLVGSPEIMRNQLDALEQHLDRDNVTLHVLPLDVQPTFGFTCMFTHFEYEDDLESDVVDIETPAGMWHVEDDKGVSRLRRHFDTLVQRALTPEKSRALIRKVAKTW
jgi:transcriptional regulator with XRE-family HTH domain